MLRLGLRPIARTVATSFIFQITLASGFADASTSPTPPSRLHNTEIEAKHPNTIQGFDGALIHLTYDAQNHVKSAAVTTKQGRNLNITLQSGSATSFSYTISGDQFAPVTVTATNYGVLVSNAIRKVSMRFTSLYGSSRYAPSPVIATVSDSSKSAVTQVALTSVQGLETYTSSTIDNAFPGFNDVTRYFAPVILTWLGWVGRAAVWGIAGAACAAASIGTGGIAVGGCAILGAAASLASDTITALDGIGTQGGGGDGGNGPSSAQGGSTSGDQKPEVKSDPSR